MSLQNTGSKSLVYPMIIFPNRSVKSSKFAADAVQLTLTNGAVVTINGASNFTYDLGGNATSGVTGSSNTLSAFAATMGVATLPTSGSTAGSSDVSISNNGLSSTSSPTFTVTKSASKISEGDTVTFTITASSAVSADTPRVDTNKRRVKILMI